MPQLTFLNTVFCTVADVTGFYTNANLLVKKPEGVALQAAIQNHINNAKDIYLRQPLIDECQKKFLTKIDDWRAFKRAQIDERLQELKRDFEIADKAGKSFFYGGYIGYDGQFFEIGDLGNFTKPGTYYFNGTPVSGTSGTYAGSAETGDILFNTATDLGYINRGTTVSPLWQRFIADDGINFILNPTELKWTNIFATGILMAGDGMFRNAANYQDPVNVNFAATAKDICSADYREALKRALSIIDFNISGSGTMTAYELGTATNEIVIF